MITPDLTGIQLKLRQWEGKNQVWDPVRKKWIILTPEEHVRQYILQYMLQSLHYPIAMIAVEKAIMVGTLKKRFDVVVYNANHEPWMLVECKAPEVELTEATLHQLLSYHSAITCNYWVLTNGRHLFCADARDVANIKWVISFPAYNM